MTLTKINSKGIKDSEILNADINASAAIAGTKITPDFGSQNIATTGNVGIGTTSPASAGSYSKFIQISDANSASVAISRSASGTAHTLELGAFSGVSLIESTSATSLRFKTNGSNAIAIDSSQQVGIGTTSPASLLTLNHATNPSIQFQDSGTKVASINAEGSQTNIASFEGKKIVFATSTGSSFNSRMAIATDGNIGIGTISPTVLLDVRESDSSTWNASSNLPTLIRAYNTSSTTGAAAGIQLRTDNSGGAAAIQYIHAVNNSTNYSSDLVFSRRVGTSATYGETCRITNYGNLRFQANRGVEFHNYGTGTNISSNTLDDYEEGTFSPGTQGFNNVSYASNTGHYTKIGRLVFIDFYIKFGGSTTSDANHIYITNLPFNIADTNHLRGGGTTSYYNLSSANVDDGNISFYGAQGDNKFSTYVGSSAWNCADGVSQVNKYLIGTFTYQSA